MKNWYYIVWADAIRSIKKNHPEDKEWKLKIFILITWAHALNLWMILLWLKHFDLVVVPNFQLELFSVNILDGALSFIVKFALIFVIINYVLIFNKNKYKMILDKYPETKYRYSGIYTLIIFIGAFISALLVGLVLK